MGETLDVDRLGVPRAGNDPELALSGDLGRQGANRFERDVYVVATMNEQHGHMDVLGG